MRASWIGLLLLCTGAGCALDSGATDGEAARDLVARGDQGGSLYQRLRAQPLVYPTQPRTVAFAGAQASGSISRGPFAEGHVCELHFRGRRDTISPYGAGERTVSVELIIRSADRRRVESAEFPIGLEASDFMANGFRASASRTSSSFVAREVVDDATAWLDAEDNSLSAIHTSHHMGSRVPGGDFSITRTLYMELADDRSRVSGVRFTTSIDGKQQAAADCEGFGPGTGS